LLADAYDSLPDFLVWNGIGGNRLAQKVVDCIAVDVLKPRLFTGDVIPRPSKFLQYELL
jgi:hypothetical protein